MTTFDKTQATTPRRAFSALALASFGALSLSACQTGEREGQDFISDDPLVGGDDGDFGETGGADTGEPSGEEGGDNGGDVEISEADIVQIEGDRLYALSQYSGLTVVDVTNPDDMRSLGTWETDAQPFEMYVDSGNAFVMFNDYYFWEWDVALDSWSSYSSSRLVALDASDPSDIQVRGEFTLPGSIQDSRRVGDVLYLVSMEDGWCWGCDGVPRTVVTSVDISDEAHPAIVDQLEFLPDGDSWDWQRSVASTVDRMYVASRTWDWNGMGSNIDVIDISAHDGTLVKGASVTVAGRIESRWQMDEYNGTLRVISQFGWSGEEPEIETFQIESSQSVVPLGQTTMNLPQPESLRSVRFDGDHAYAITAEQIDPLFTIDLSDPANPLQVGELEIPGWVYHMEPRGDRVLALGYDPAHPDGSINVSLFDVSVFDSPTLRRRVHFGGDWADFAEDQNRIHKAFAILEDENMLLVPYSGWEYTDGGFEGCGNYRSGVQIIDWLNDDLTLRGALPVHGRARRAMTHRERILTLSDAQLASFDYSNRDMPQARDQLQVAVNVGGLTKSGQVWVRTSQDWWTGNQVIEIVAADDPGSPEPLGSLDLSQLSDCGYAYVEDLFAIDDHVFVLQSVEDFSNGNYQSIVRLLAIDISDPTAPVIADEFELPGMRDWGSSWIGGVRLSSSWAAQQGEHLTLLMRSDNDDPVVNVVDLSNPSALEISATLARPAGQTQGELSVMSDTIVSWHTEPVPNEPGKVRFYFDRLVLDAEPNWAPSINVPGVIVAYAADAGRAFTVDFQVHTYQTDWQTCYEDPKFFDFGWETEQLGTCTTMDQPLREIELVGDGANLVRTHDIERGLGLDSLWASDARLFARVGHPAYYYDENGNPDDNESRLVVLDVATADIQELDGAQFGSYWSPTAVDGTRGLISGGGGQLSLIDATDLEHIEVQQSELPGWGSCYDPVIDGDSVYCPQGAYGVETVSW
jgi:hypothetical protein